MPHAPRFADQAPAEIYATLLDEGVYHCSIRTMYRVLSQHGEVRERREQLRRPIYRKPELLAERPNEVWSWDITKLMGPTKWSYFDGGIGLMTPDQVHYGHTDVVHAGRQTTLDQAFRDNPERFVNKPPTPPAKPTAAWINPPTPNSRT